MNLTLSVTTLSLSGLILFLVNLQQALESSKQGNQAELTEDKGHYFIFNAGFMSECVCPGDILTHECTVTGGVSTVWTGNAFNCQSSNNEITLLHSCFKSANGTSRSCNNGAIVGQSLGVQGDNYTSQLNVTITPETAGKTIMCIGDNGKTTMLIFSILIPSIG